MHRSRIGDRVPGPKVIELFSCSTQLMGAQWLSGRVLDCRPKGRRSMPQRRHSVVSLSKNINPSLVLVQPRKTRPFITERLLMGHKESNQTKTNKSTQLSTKYILLTNVKMPTIFGILTFISKINTISERQKANNFFYSWYFSFYEQLKLSAQLS